MCRCGGASEHDHLNKAITVTKSLNSLISKERTFALNVKNPSKLVEKVLREKFFVEESTNEDEDLTSDVDDQIIINIQ